MIRAFRTRFSVKLFVSYFLLIVLLILTLWAVISLTAPAAYNRHLGGMEQMMNDGGGTMMGQGQGPPSGRGQGQGSTNYADFRASLDEAFLLAGAAAVLLALVVSLILSRQVVRPLRAISDASLRIADGHYDERVQGDWEDEFGRLAQNFNQMAEKLEQVERMRIRLIGDVSHELRTPLTAIKGSMEGLVDGVLPANAETFEDIHQQAERLNRLIDDLQELSRVESGAIDIQFGRVQMPDVIKTATRMLEAQFVDRSVTLEIDLPTALHPVLIDEGRTLQVLVNLLGNALRYTPSGGKVIVSALERDKEMQISVSDTGVGISKTHIGQIFDRFYRIDKSRSRQNGAGSGIGLTISRHLVEAQGGRIWVESEGEGKGSVFSFTLPLEK